MPSWNCVLDSGRLMGGDLILDLEAPLLMQGIFLIRSNRRGKYGNSYRYRETSL
jgi:hypothetical protein